MLTEKNGGKKKPQKKTKKTNQLSLLPKNKKKTKPPSPKQNKTKKKHKKKRKKKKKNTKKKHKKNHTHTHTQKTFRSFFLDGWSDRAVRWENARFLTLLTASGRPDQSHRLAPVSITPFLSPTKKTTGRVGRAKKNTTYSRKGALTTARPLLVNSCLTRETCAKNFADTCYTASGLRAESQLQPSKRNIEAE